MGRWFVHPLPVQKKSRAHAFHVVVSGVTVDSSPAIRTGKENRSTEFVRTYIHSLFHR